jgi:hypothetical protein
MNEREYAALKYLTDSGATLDTLIALVERGPLDDGDIPSKSGRSQLVEVNCAAKILVNGADGFNAATYKGRELYCYYFGKSDTIKEAKAYRQAANAIRDMKRDD